MQEAVKVMEDVEETLRRAGWEGKGRERNTVRASPGVLNEVSADPGSLKLMDGEEEHPVKLAGDRLKRKNEFPFMSSFILK